MKHSNFFQLSLLFISISLVASCGESEGELEKTAADIHKQVLTVDTHADTPGLLLRGDYDLGRRNPSDQGPQVDFPRMKEGGLDAIFLVVYLGQGKLTQEGYDAAHERALRTFDVIRESLDSYPEMAEPALTPDDAYTIAEKGKRAIYIGVENGYPIGRDLSRLRKYYDLGARYLTLSHGRHNQICDSSTDTSEPLHNGLSNFGREVVKEMNRLGMIVDISHIADRSVRDVLETTRAPVLATHSNAKAVHDHPRNLNDDLLRGIAENGGVVHVTFVSSFVAPGPPNPERDSARAAVLEKWNNFEGLSEEDMEQARKEWDDVNRKFPLERATVSDLVDHIDHIVEVAGIDHVAIGSDFDGGGRLEDCHDATEIGNITRELVRRGYSKEETEKIWSGNFMRVFREVERVAQKLRAEDVAAGR